MAVLAISLITMSKTAGSDVSIRTFDQYVPLAFALLCISNPDFTIVDNLSTGRLTHDMDVVAVACNVALQLP